MKKDQAQDRALTDLELVVMNAIWVVGEFKIADIVAELGRSAEKNYAYTTIATIVKILEKKKYIKSTRDGKTYRYQVLIEKEKYEGLAVNDLVGKVFNGSVDRFVCRLLGSSKISPKQLDKIKATLLEELGGE